MKKLFILLITLLSFQLIDAQIFYKVEKPGEDKVSYLFGTHHLAPVKILKEKGVTDILDSLDMVVGELNFIAEGNLLPLKMQQYMMAPADSTLSKVISPEDFALISNEFKNWAPMEGMSLSMLEPMKPMVVSSMVSVTIAAREMEDYAQGEQIDSYIQQQAAQKGIAIEGLETVEFQADVLFNSTPISLQAKALVDLLSDPAKSIELTKKLNKAYKNGDLEMMMLLSDEEQEDPAFFYNLVDKRNKEWVKKLPELFKDKRILVAVGALHLPGENGLIKQLTDLGYIITPIDLPIKEN